MISLEEPCVLAACKLPHPPDESLHAADNADLVGAHERA